MIIALIYLDKIDRVSGICMPSENHLTIRDYFDRVIGARPRNRRKFVPDKVRLSENRTFHQMLTSQRRKHPNRPEAKSGGLKITDYLARPVRAKSRFNLRSVKTAVDKSKANEDILSGHPALVESKDPPQIASAPPPSLKTDLSPPHPAGLRSFQKTTGTGEHQIIETSILRASRRYDLPVNLIKSVIRAESNFQVNAVSHAGALGLMQLMPATAQELGVKDPFDIQENIDGGSRYLRKMLDSFGGDLKLALAAYNAGPEAVIKYGRKVPPYRETQLYVKRVLR
jgi:hypothetical protein